MLIKQAITTFSLLPDFTMPMSTVCSRITSGNMEVSHPREAMPLAGLEPMLAMYIYSAWRVGRPLSGGKIYALANSLLHNSELEVEFIQWKTKQGLWDPLNPDDNTLSLRWLANYQRQNQELFQAKNPKKFGQNCEAKGLRRRAASSPRRISTVSPDGRGSLRDV